MAKNQLPSPANAKAQGRAMREAITRGALAKLADRDAAYDPVERLIWQSATRRPDLVGLRYSRMLTDLFSFYRGNALLMAEDLARGSSSALEVQLCGDAHLANFNLFSSPERHLVFDVNDFDETDVGPFEWDIKRLVTSLAVASSHLGHTNAQQERIALSAAREYRLAVRRFAGETRLNVWYATLDIDAVVTDLGGFFNANALHRVDSVVAHATGRDTQKAYARLVVDGEHGPRIVSKPPLLVPLEDLNTPGYLTRGDLDRLLSGYAKTLSRDRQVLLAQFTPVDAARKIVGVGSVGTECYVMLLLGRDEFDPFFLQIKQAGTSVVSTALGRTPVVVPGERVVLGQRQMQATPDVFIGWHSMKKDGEERHYYARQLYDNKAAINIDQLDERLLVTYGRICAWTLARAHARSGRGAEIAGYLGKSDVADEALATFALAYRDRTTSDFAALQRAAKEGRITLAT
jgi:uncharacterized protein (DUF2252 family)